LKHKGTKYLLLVRLFFETLSATGRHKGTKKTKGFYNGFVFFVPLWFKTLKQKQQNPLFSLCLCVSER
jgi:hypothetical protein